MLLCNLELAHENISNSNECLFKLYLSSAVGHRVRCVPTRRYPKATCSVKDKLCNRFNSIEIIYFMYMA